MENQRCGEADSLGDQENEHALDLIILPAGT